MITARCQICGREKPLTIDGVVFKHYVAGEVCFGSGNLPFSASCAALEAGVAHYQVIDERYLQVYKRHRDERRNSPQGAQRAFNKSQRLGGRRHER